MNNLKFDYTKSLPFNKSLWRSSLNKLGASTNHDYYKQTDKTM